MDETLPIESGAAALPSDRPFTRATARAAGVERAALDRMMRAGSVRRLLRGVYADATVPDTRELRAAAAALVADPDHVVVDRTAAWVHGVDVAPLLPAGPVPLDTVMQSASGRRSRRSTRQLAAHDVERIDGLLVTSPLRTALDLGRSVSPALALGAMDGLLAGGTFTHAQLLAEVSRLGGLPGAPQLRRLAVQVDARSLGAAESALRLHWHEARLPTAIPGLPVSAAGRLVRLSLGVPQRQFGAVLAGQVAAADLVALQSVGWRIVVLSDHRVLHTDPAYWVAHLEREFHQQLLAQTG